MSSSVALLITLLLVFPILSYASTSSNPKGALNCSSSCGIHNISPPFRLNDSPYQCGNMRYNLSCENNQLVMYWQSGKYNVQSINYNNYTIRVVDANVVLQNYSSLPRNPLASYNFSNQEDVFEPYQDYQYSISCSPSSQKQKIRVSPETYCERRLTKAMIYLTCQYPVHSSDATTTCINNSYGEGSIFLVNVDNKSLWDLGLGDSCRIEMMYLTSWPAEYINHTNISCGDIYNMLVYGFELSWLKSSCGAMSVACLGEPYERRCLLGAFFRIYYHAVRAFSILFLIGSYFLIRCVLVSPFIIMLICCFNCRRKHLSMYNNIEDFLQSDNNIMPIRYSYKDIKRITKGFKIKLGNGGYGSVFKGKLQSSGRLVAVKVLDKAKADGREFINEVATIGTIHHVNVVQLIGFCVEGSKRALIYEFMPNGSLEKYIFSHGEGTSSLSCETLYSISLGIARGIDYLHNGCNMKILHFDIKPHNILLDENFNPKVSDFGLARLYPTDNSIVSLTAARGTLGYMAPELFYRNVGTISYKADVYSFGMLLMEMACRRRNVNPLTEHSNRIYYPSWVYDQLHDGKEITIENDTDEEMKLAKKMMVVAIWCIQTRPSDRPSMDEVLEMLQGDEELQMPSKPSLFPQEIPKEDHDRDRTSSRPSSNISSVGNSKESI